jgi:hypothetical protein
MRLCFGHCILGFVIWILKFGALKLSACDLGFENPVYPIESGFTNKSRIILDALI